MAARGIVRRTKLSDVIVEEVKRLIVSQALTPGDRMPSESELIEKFRCAKGTVREALKALEVEGLVVTRPGPGGGAYLATSNSEPAARMLRNYLHFQHLDGLQIYQMRKLVEPELAASVVGCLTDAQVQALEDNVLACSRRPSDEEEQLEQRRLELEFHNILADACPNPLLAFVGRFLNDMLRDLVVLKGFYKPKRDHFGVENASSHRALLDAFRAHDRDRVRSIMFEHMREAEKNMAELEDAYTNHSLLSLS